MNLDYWVATEAYHLSFVGSTSEVCCPYPPVEHMIQNLGAIPPDYIYTGRISLYLSDLEAYTDVGAVMCYGPKTGNRFLLKRDRLIGVLYI